MKKYDVLDIAIKILGLSLIPNAMYYIGEIAVLFPVIYSFDESERGDLSTFFSYLFGTILFILPILLFVFKTKWLLNKILKLDEAESSVDIELSRQSFIEIALVIIGGIALIRNVPGFITQIIQKIQVHKLNIDMPDNSFPNSWMYRDGSEIILAIIFIVYAKSLAIYFSKRANKSEKIILPNE